MLSVCMLSPFELFNIQPIFVNYAVNIMIVLKNINISIFF